MNMSHSPSAFLLRCAAFCFAVSLLLTGCSSQPAADAPEEIPIFAYHALPQKFTTVERFREMKDCGITFFSPVMDEDSAIRQCLDTAAVVGVKAVVNGIELENSPETFVSKYKDHPGLGGYFLADEPGTDGLEWLGEWIDRIRSVDSTHFCYVNLLPVHAFGEEEYARHLETYCSEVPLPYISFDYYPVLFDKSNGRTIVSPFWYQNLQMVSDMAASTGRTFSGFALTTAHSLYPVPTLAHIRFQFYTNLAYGAQSLQVFTYWTPKEYGENDFHLGPITRAGKRSLVYELLREAAQEIQKRAFVFKGSEQVDVSFLPSENSDIPIGTKPLERLPEHFAALECHASVSGTSTNARTSDRDYESPSNGILVSTLKKGSTTYIVLVNASPTEPVSVTIETDDSVSRIRRDGSTVQASLYDTLYTLEPGSAEIFSYQD